MLKPRIIGVVLMAILAGVNIATPALQTDVVFYDHAVVGSGEVYRSVSVYDSPSRRTTVEFYGEAEYLTMYDSSILNLHEGAKFESFGGGWNRLYKSSTLNVFEGAKIGAGSAANMDLYDLSTLNIYGGIVDMIVVASDAATINLHKGSLGMLGAIADNSTLNVYSGYVDVFLTNFDVSPTSTVNIYGYGFEYKSNGRWMPPIGEGQGWWVSKLTGYSFTGNPITVWGLPDPKIHVNINLIPEPMTLLLLGLGWLCLFKIRGCDLLKMKGDRQC